MVPHIKFESMDHSNTQNNVSFFSRNDDVFLFYVMQPIIKGKNMQNQKTIKLRGELNVWIYETYHPNYFLSVRLSKNKETFNQEKADKEVWRILKKFEKVLVGRNWKKKHLPFVMFAENHYGYSSWHYHLLFNGGKYTQKELQNAIYKTKLDLKMSDYTMDLRKETYTPNNLRDYCTKELKVRYMDEVETDRIIISDVLFYIENKYRFIPAIQKRNDG